MSSPMHHALQLSTPQASPTTTPLASPSASPSAPPTQQLRTAPLRQSVPLSPSATLPDQKLTGQARAAFEYLSEHFSAYLADEVPGEDQFSAALTTKEETTLCTAILEKPKFSSFVQRHFTCQWCPREDTDDKGFLLLRMTSPVHDAVVSGLNRKITSFLVHIIDRHGEFATASDSAVALAKEIEISLNTIIKSQTHGNYARSMIRVPDCSILVGAAAVPVFIIEIAYSQDEVNVYDATA